jgi:hypothetical protein
LLLTDLALEKPLELDVRLPRPRDGRSSKTGSCDSCVDSGAVAVFKDLGFSLSRKDLLPPEVGWPEAGGAPYLGPGSPDLGPGKMRPDESVKKTRRKCSPMQFSKFNA